MAFYLLSEIVRANKVDSLSAVSDATPHLLKHLLKNSSYSFTGQRTFLQDLLQSPHLPLLLKIKVVLTPLSCMMIKILPRRTRTVQHLPRLKTNFECSGDSCQLDWGFNILRFGIFLGDGFCGTLCRISNHNKTKITTTTKKKLHQNPKKIKKKKKEPLWLVISRYLFPHSSSLFCCSYLLFSVCLTYTI